jgi:hypothetical protein
MFQWERRGLEEEEEEEEESDRGVKLAPHLLLVSRSRMLGAISPPAICLHGVVLS